MATLENRTKFFAHTLLAWLFLNFMPAQAQASLSLHDTRTEVDRLAPDVASAQAVFLVDDAERLEFDIVATASGMTTRILTPNGDVVDPDNVVTFGGEFTSFTIPLGMEREFITPAEQPGFHSVYRLPSRGVGSYTVQYHSSGLTKEVAVITQLTTNSRLVAALVAPASQVVAGNTAVLSAAVFDGTQPFVGAFVQVSLRGPDGQYSTLTLLDDGAGADDVIGDGLYSGEWTGTVPGTYRALARITGTRAGRPFFREAATQLTILEQSSHLSGNFTDRAVDDNFNSLFERVVVEAGTNTLKAGSYRLFVGLKGSNGKTLIRTSDSNLSAGPGSVAVSFEALALRELGDGPYRIAFFELMRLDNLGVVAADRLDDVGQTQAYRLSEFERPLIALTGTVTDYAYDDNANGLFDRLKVDVEVDVARPGYYNYGFKLMDRNSVELGFYSRSVYLSAGRHALTAVFPGKAIGENGVDGPFAVRDLLIYGAGGSLVSVTAGQTQPYRARQFEGFALDTTPPQINVSVSPSTLWPPNHELVPITATVRVTDDQDPNPTVQLVSIVSNEPDNGTGDGDTPNDIQGAVFASDDRQFTLRAERSGRNSGRVYTVTYRARDQGGNEALATSTVTVQHNR